MSLGMPEIVVLLVIALLIFGPSRLPGLGKSMGEAIRGFKKGVDGAGDKDVTDASERLEESRAGESRTEGSRAGEAPRTTKVKTEEHS